MGITFSQASIKCPNSDPDPEWYLSDSLELWKVGIFTVIKSPSCGDLKELKAKVNPKNPFLSLNCPEQNVLEGQGMF